MSYSGKVRKLMAGIETKLVTDRHDLIAKVESWRKDGQKVVFTNGCFDLVHPGHIYSLLEARSLGDRLLIGINSDESVRKLKGAGRPVNELQSRMILLAALEFTDLIVSFEESTPEELIRLVRPDILVKGGDYSVDQIAGADFVLENGGKVMTIGFLEGYSSSEIVRRIQNLKHD